MPVGIIAGATAVAGIGSAVIGSMATKSAAKSAAATSEQATQAQLQLGRESLALNTDIYNSNFGLLSPSVSRGNVAGDAINALLGLPAAPAMTSPLASRSGANATPADEDTWATAAMNALKAEVNPMYWAQVAGITDPSDKLAALEPLMQTVDRQVYGSYLASNPRPIVSATPPPATGATAQPPATTPQSAQSAMTNFANSAGMKFAQQEGANTINMGAAGNGWLESGAALKALQQRGQDIALQQYFPMYTGLLSNQQAVGAQSAAAAAGVGSNFGNTAAGINSNLSGSIGANAANIGNSQLAAGAANANMWGNVGSSIGSSLGMLGSSYINKGY